MSKFKQKLMGGLADKKKPSDFDPKALKQGQKVEMEHTDDPAKAEEISMDHLTEDPKYYDKLELIEKAFVEQQPKAVIGQTESGKDVLGNNKEEYSQDFNSQDHEDAAKLHEDKAAQYQMKQRQFMLSKPKGFNHKLLSIFNNLQARHQDNADWHKDQIENAEGEKKDSDSLITKALKIMYGYAYKLQKGGEGSGKQGHHTDRKPYPGVDQHKAPKGDKPAAKTYIPAGGDFIPRYYDSPGLKSYKTLLSLFKKEGLDYSGHISFNPQTQEIVALTDKGKKAFEALQDKYVPDAKPKQMSSQDFFNKDKVKKSWLDELLESLD